MAGHSQVCLILFAISLQSSVKCSEDEQNAELEDPTGRRHSIGIFVLRKGSVLEKSFTRATSKPVDYVSASSLSSLISSTASSSSSGAATT